MTFEGTDAIVAVADALGPIDAVVAHSAGCGMTTGAIGEGWGVERAAFIAPPIGEGDRWMRYAEKLGTTQGDALAAKAFYYAARGPDARHGDTSTAYPALDVDMLVVQSRATTSATRSRTCKR